MRPIILASRSFRYTDRILISSLRRGFHNNRTNLSSAESKVAATTTAMGATTLSKPWADTPLKLISDTGLGTRSDIPPNHSAIECAQKMALLHNVILRAFNASYNQCLAVQAGAPEARDFLIFNQALWEHIKEHHAVEETYLFPALQELTGEEGIMEQNISEHQDFEEGLEKLRTFAFETDGENYNGVKFRDMLDLLGSALEKHLHAEIPTMLDLAKFDSEKLGKIWAETSQRGAQGTHRTRVGPMMLGCGDRDFVLDGKVTPFPIPFFVPYLSKYILQIPRAGAWRFNPCDDFQVRRPLAFPNPENKG